MQLTHDADAHYSWRVDILLIFTISCVLLPEKRNFRQLELKYNFPKRRKSEQQSERERDLQESMCVSIDVHFTGRWKWRGVWFVECKTNLINLAAFPCPTLWPVLLHIMKKSEGETYWNMLFKMPSKHMLATKKKNLSHNIKFNKCFAYTYIRPTIATHNLVTLYFKVQFSLLTNH